MQSTESNINLKKSTGINFVDGKDNLSNADKEAIMKAFVDCSVSRQLNAANISSILNERGINAIVIPGSAETINCKWSIWQIDEAQYIYIFQNVPNETVTNLKQKLKEQTEDINHLKNKIEEYESKEIPTFLRNPIEQYMTTIQPLRPGTDIVTKHNQNMSEWMEFTEEMNNEYTKHKQDVDNDKENDGNTSSLLYAYIQCKELWQQQQNQMESITECLSELTKRKKQLKGLIRNHTENTNIKHNQYEQELNKYDETKQTRQNLEEELREKLSELNDCCDKENELNQNQSKLCAEYEALDMELAAYKSILKNCNELIKKYTKFDSVNEDTITEMEKYFDDKWIECMRTWYKWNSESIIYWIMYLREKKQLVLSNEIDLDKILQQMKNDKVDGDSLLNIDKDDLKSIGFEILSDRKEVYGQIMQLVSKYPYPSSYNDEGNNNEDDIFENDDEIKIPTEFLCPLSDKIMKNPVQIFDGNTYEKSQIKAYLDEYRKSPTTKEECDEEDIWFTPNRKLKQKISAFLCVHPQFEDTMDTFE